MLTEKWEERISQRTTLLDKLIRQRGIERYGLFGVTAEGRELPDGSESASGFLVDSNGQVFMFWLDQDRSTRAVMFTKWRPVNLGENWGDDDEEYRQARTAAGLA